VYPTAAVPLGTLVRRIGTHATQVRLVYQCHADPGVLTGETAKFSFTMSAKGYRDVKLPVEFTISMNHDYSVVNDLTWSENFDGPAAFAWTHTVSGTNPNDEWSLVNCDSHSGAKSYHNGGTDCSNYSDDQGNPYLASPPY